MDDDATSGEHRAPVKHAAKKRAVPVREAARARARARVLVCVAPLACVVCARRARRALRAVVWAVRVTERGGRASRSRARARGVGGVWLSRAARASRRCRGRAAARRGAASRCARDRDRSDRAVGEDGRQARHAGQHGAGGGRRQEKAQRARGSALVKAGGRVHEKVSRVHARLGKGVAAHAKNAGRCNDAAAANQKPTMSLAEAYETLGNLGPAVRVPPRASATRCDGRPRARPRAASATAASDCDELCRPAGDGRCARVTCACVRCFFPTKERKK